jgi:dihydrofolate reductase
MSLKPRIAFVVAVARNGVIGRDGRLPWHMSSDLQRFKALTMGKPVLMGRRTWESLPRKPLPGRLNIVVTRQADYAAAGAVVARDLDHALQVAADAGTGEICVIGGAEVFRELMPNADRLYLSEIDLDTAGDAFFPEVNASEWKEISRETVRRGPKDDAGFTFRVLDRIRPVPQS